MSNALDSHWNYLTVAVNMLQERSFDSEEDVISYIGEMETLLETDGYHSMLMFLDSQEIVMTPAESMAFGPISIGFRAGRRDIRSYLTAIYMEEAIGPLCRSWIRHWCPGTGLRLPM